MKKQYSEKRYFGNKEVSDLKYNQIQYIIKSLERKYEISYQDKTYRFLDNNSYQFLRQNKHSIALTTFGQKYFMFFTKLNDKTVCIFINKKYNKFYMIEYKNVSEKLFNDTLIDGEFLKNNDEKWTFCVCDILIYKGDILNKANLAERIEICRDIFDNELANNQYICEFIIQEYFDYEYMDDLVERYQNMLNYKCSGLIFKNFSMKTKDLLYIFPKNRTRKTVPETIVNNQVSHESLVNLTNTDVKINNDIALESSFMMKKTNFSDIYELYCSKDDSYVKYDIASVNTIRISHFLYYLFHDDNNNELILKNDVFVKCTYNPLFKKWMPCKITDKVDKFEWIKNCEEYIQKNT
jgi:hypothetical protein